MKELGGAVIQSNGQSPETGQNRVLVKPESFPEIRTKVQQSFRTNPFELPFHIASYATDVIGAGFEFSGAWWINPRFLPEKEIPRGNGESVMMETGLLGSEWLFRPMGSWLSQIGYQPVYARHPYGFNWELISKRSEALLQISEQQKNGKKAKWIVWSKGTLAAILAIKQHPDKVAELVDHIAFLGIPLECEINPVVSQVYIITQGVNKALFGEDDFDLLDRLDLADGVEIPEGVGFTVIDTKHNGVSTFQNGNYPQTRFVNGTHSGLGFNFSAFEIIAQRFAAK